METAAVEVRKQVVEVLDQSDLLSDDDLREVIEQHVFAYSLNCRALTAGEKKQLVDRLYHSFRGLDVLQPLIDDPAITEIMVNSYRDIFIERGGGITRTAIRFDSKEKLEDVIQSIVGKVNRAVNESTPIVDARLPDGSRVHVVLPPAALHGPALTIRKFPEKPIRMEDLVRLGALSEKAARFLSELIRAKYNIFIGGGTGSGKTTFLNALAEFIPADERIVTIEDSAELQIRNIPNLVGLETRNANTEGKGEITVRDLIRASLRMRPNRIIVGEVRGPEALDMLQAMNTGHEGSMSTGHANSAADMLSRLETMVLSGADLPLPVVRKQIASALDIVVHLSRMRDKSRKITEILEVTGMVNGEIQLNPLYRYQEEEREEDNSIKGKLIPTGIPLRHTEKLKNAGLYKEGGEEASV